MWMLPFLLLLAAFLSAAVMSAASDSVAIPDALTLVRQSIAQSEDDYDVRSRYIYEEHDTVTTLDGDNRRKTVHTKTSEVLTIGGRSYTRLLSRDGAPLPAKEAKAEQNRMDRAIAEAKRLTPEQRAAQEAEVRKRADTDRERRKAIPDAFNWELLGPRTLNGRPVWKLRATPKAGYSGKFAGLLRNIQGTLFLDRQDRHWVRLEALALRDISLGLFLAKISEGSLVSFEEARVNNEVWLPARISASARARFLVKHVHQEEEITYTNYRKFQSDSRLLTTSASDAAK